MVSSKEEKMGPKADAELNIILNMTQEERDELLADRDQLIRFLLKKDKW